MRRRFWLYSAILTLLVCAPAGAQAPDSARMSDDVRKGFAALELYQQTNSLEHASQAARLFSGAIKSDTDDPWAHYGLGATLVHAKKTMAIVRTLGVADGEAMPVAQRELEKALDLAPDFVLAAELLAQAAEKPKNREALHRAYAVLEKNGVLRKFIERTDSSAAVLARTAVTGLDHLRRARVLFERNDDAAGEAAYFAGAAMWDEAAAEAYVNDAALIATPDEMVSLTDGILEKRRNSLGTFWRKRTVRDGVSAAERLGEHFRRIAHARARYPMRAQERTERDVFGKKRIGVAKEIDDRGLIYIRFGEPSEYHRRDAGIGLDPSASESWAYLNADGRYSVYHFTNGRLAADLLGTIGNPFSGDVRDAAAVIGDMAKYDPRYAFIAARLETLRTWAFMPAGSGGTDRIRASRMASLLEDVRRQNERISDDNRARIFEAFHRDAAPPRFEQPLMVFHDFATFRGSGCTDVVYTVAAAVPSYRVTLAIADTFFWDAKTVDATVSKELTPGGLLRATGVLCTAPDYNAYMRLNVAADSLTGATVGGDLTIPDYADRSALLMSDLLFATTEAGPFARGNARLALVPPRQFREGEPFRTFYELYNMPVGRKYRTEITLETVRSNPFAKLFKGKSKTTVSFEDEVRTGDVVQELRTLVPEIEPGEVRITVKVTDLATRVSASRRETIWILPAD